MSTIIRREPDRSESFPGEVRGPGAGGFCRAIAHEPGRRRALDPGRRRGTAWRHSIESRLRRLGYAALALAGWTAIMLAMPFLGPAGREVAVVGDPSAAIRAIARAGG